MAYQQFRRFRGERKNGYGVNLYRNDKKKKIGGVCAGLADHFDIDHWVMRAIFIAGFLFINGAIIWIYVIAWLALIPKSSASAEESIEYDEEQRRYRKKNIFRYKKSSSERILRAKSRLNRAQRRVENMESYVTSNKYNLNQEFADLEK